jgi:hypothetical protein
MASSQPPAVERRPRRPSPKADLRELLRLWSQAASARGVSKKAIRTVRIASELGEEGWPLEADAPPLTAPAWFEPCTEMRCVAFARYCLDHYTERESLLWRYRHKELKRLHDLAVLAEALAPEVEAARTAQTARKRGGEKGGKAKAKMGTKNAEAVRSEWAKLVEARPLETPRVSTIAQRVNLSQNTVRNQLDALGLKMKEKRTTTS